MAELPDQGMLILGGLGYFGSRLAEALAVNGPVTVTSRSMSGARARWLAGRSPAITWRHFDSAAPSDIEGAFDAVVNCATPSAAESASDPARATALALETVAACLRLLKQGRVKRVVHVSTFHVYGGPAARVLKEDDEPRPAHPYGAIHLACERALLSSSGRPPIVVLRPTNIVGAPAHADLGVQSSLLFLDCCRQAVHGRQIVLRSNGLGYRDFVAMGDAIRAVTIVLAACASGPEIFNLAAGEAVTVKFAAEQIQLEAQALLGIPIGLLVGSGEDSIRERFVVDRTKLGALGWQPERSIGEEIRQTLRFFQAEPPS